MRYIVGMNNRPIRTADPVRMPNLPDGDRYTAPELIRMCAKYSIRPYISELSGGVSFVACLGTALDPNTGKYKKIRETFSPAKWGGVKDAFEAAREWCRNSKGLSQADKAGIIAIPPHIAPQVLWALEECRKRDTNLMAVFQAGFREIEGARIKEAVTFAEAAARLLESKVRDSSATYLADLRTFFKCLGEEFGDRKLHEITVEELEDWLDDREIGPVTWNNKRRILGVLWNYGLEQRNQWVKENVASQIRIRTVKDEEITALTIEQAKGVLRCAHYSLPRLVPYLVVSMFCGLRRSEVQRTDWSDFDWETRSLMVRVTKSRSASSRYVHLSDVAIDWLKPLAQPGGPICTGMYGRREDLKRLRELTFDFDGNIFRHSFGTYHYRGFNNPQSTIVEMGHTTVQMLHKHYKKPVTPTKALEYWKLTRATVLTPPASPC